MVDNVKCFRKVYKVYKSFLSKSLALPSGTSLPHLVTFYF